MSEQVNLRLDVPADLRDQFKASCAEHGMSMGDQAALLLRGWIDSQASSLSAANDVIDPDRIIVVEAEDGPAPLIDEIRNELGAHTAKLMGAIKPVAGCFAALEQLVKYHAQLIEQQVSRGCDKVSSEVISNDRLWRQQMARHRDDWKWLGGALGAGLVLACVLLWLVSGSGIGRSLATSLTGADNRWQAALMLAGDGSKLHAGLMNETHALLKDATFRDGFGQCVERAKRARTQPVTCKLVVTPLVTR